ncbi:hypothetical protein Mp_3g10460 [Marchantia polymorpha subsp. ruderalis]|uniref:LRAT domain-containing protein n=2 Tax=Marchantia polymorpha TaxID=3197 RepID=A0AAF6AZD3_MARPO|nr:hypothetical protein MARPO_0203s0001 [Marchantia polymorpha]BBN05117.1 hypothetical protein Mp_3g10460 [Marchantia polymorpha subsp. ruderalis]|eukprot:PTQ27352.1 hypothetical protein MARPO_0203s0001 [Marchantia polymorpha]
MKSKLEKRIINTCLRAKYALDVKEGDHVYSYRSGGKYTHHGIVDADGRLIHIVRNRHLYKDKTHRRTSGLIRPGSKKCQDENCPTYFGDRNCGVIKTCIECFKEDGELHKYYYGNKSYCSWKLIDGVTTTESEKSSDPAEISARARHSLENNNFEHYDLVDNNCEDFALYCSTGRRGEKSKQISRLGELKHFVSVVDAILQLRRTDAACGCDVHTCTFGPYQILRSLLL